MEEELRKELMDQMEETIKATERLRKNLYRSAERKITQEQRNLELQRDIISAMYRRIELQG